MQDPRPDSALMMAWQQGDEAAFEILYARHKAPLYRYLLRQSGIESVSAELAQDVWLNIVRARARYRPRAKFTTYLYRLARNRFIDHVRQQKRRPQPADTHGDDIGGDLPDAKAFSQAEQVDAASLGDAIRAALSELPAEQREAFLLREEGGLSVADIAEVTGVGRETAKSRLRYASARLRERLAPWLERVND